MGGGPAPDHTHDDDPDLHSGSRTTPIFARMAARCPSGLCCDLAGSLRGRPRRNFRRARQTRAGRGLCASRRGRGSISLVLDQTRPDIGVPVIRVIVPGLRHFYRRFAPGRLYDVPVKLGLRKTPLREQDLNPLLPKT